jgi:uncharacterized protein YbjT (DUF2867 family)
MILIVGGTGALGSVTVQQLLAKGKAVRVMTRTPAKATALQALGADIVQGDLRDTASLQRACAGVDQVFASAHSIFGKGREASKYVDLQGHKALIDAAKAAGAKRFVYTSAYPYGPPLAAVPFWQIKAEVARYLQASGLDYTILRPTAFMESHAYMLIGQPILETGKVTLFGRGENLRNFVAVADVAQLAVMALADGKLKNQVVDIGGPENLTNMEVVRLYEQVAGRPSKVSHVPIAALNMMYRLLRPFHPGLSQVMQSSILFDTTDCTLDMSQTLEQYPITLTKLADWMQTHVPETAVYQSA